MDLGVRPQHKMLWGEDLGPETDVDNPELPRDGRPESGQGDVVDVSSESEEEEWKYVKGATKPEDKKQIDERQNDNKSQLNPNASEFFPGIEKFNPLEKEEFIASSPGIEKFNPLEKEEFIASSPGMSQVVRINLDEIDVPSETEFEHDISTRACDLEPAADVDSIDTSVANLENSMKMDASFDDEIKMEGVSLILTPQSAEAVPKAETNPFADDMQSSTESDRVDFVQNYFGKSDLDFKPFASVAPHQSAKDKLVRSEDLLESHISNSVSETSNFNVIDPSLDEGENPPVEETEKERNQLEIKEPESPANSESCSNGAVETDDHHNRVEDFPVDKAPQVPISSDKIPSDVKTSVFDDVEPNCFVDTSVKDLDLAISNVTRNVEPEKDHLFDTEDNLSHETKMCLEDETRVSLHEEDPEQRVDMFEKLEEVKKVDVCEVVDSDNVISNFVEEVLSDITHSEPETKERGPLGGLDHLHVDYPSAPVTDDNLLSEQVNVSKENHCEESELNDVNEDLLNDDRNAFVEKQLINTNDCTEVFNGQKDDFGVNPFVDKNIREEVSNKNDDVVNDMEVACIDSKPMVNKFERKDLISPVEETTYETSAKDTIVPSEEVVGTYQESITLHKDDIIPQDEIITAAVEITHGVPCADFTDEQCQENINVSDDGVNKTSVPELADTIGPNSFSFSQPYEVEVHRMTPTDLIMGFRKNNDIMTTSMHESLEQDSPFQFISGSSIREVVIDNSSELVHVSQNDVTEAISEEVGTHLVKEIDHIESPPINGVLEAESAIVESHEVPVSSEPDLVFVEQICPTVEVRSDEASPVNKENGVFELNSALNAAGITTALGTAAVALAALPEQKESESKKEDNKVSDAKTSSKPSSKIPPIKKPTASAAAKSQVTKSAPKSAVTKVAPMTSKPKVAPTTKPTTTLTQSKARTAPLASKTSVTSTAKAAPLTAKPAAKSTTVPPTKALSKPATTTTTRTLLSPAKPTPRPLSAPAKSSGLLTKPALTKTTFSSPRAPLATKKLPSPAKPSLGPKTASENKVPKAVPLKTSVPPSTRPSVPKTASTLAAKPPTRLGVSAASANKLKPTSPTKPAPIKAKSPLANAKRPTSALVKKTTVLDKNAKNAVKSAPKETAQKEIISNESQLIEEAVSSTANGHHIENGNVTPLEEVPSIM